VSLSPYELKQMDEAYAQLLKSIESREAELAQSETKKLNELKNLEAKMGRTLEDLFKKQAITPSERITIGKMVDDLATNRISYNPERIKEIGNKEKAIRLGIDDCNRQLDAIKAKTDAIIDKKKGIELSMVDKMLDESDPGFTWGGPWDVIEAIFNEIDGINKKKSELKNQLNGISGENRQELLLKTATEVLKIMAETVMQKKATSDKFEKSRTKLRQSLADEQGKLQVFLGQSKDYIDQSLDIPRYTVCSNDPISTNASKIPINVCIGEYETQSLSNPLFKRLYGIDYFSSAITLNTRKGGNIVIKPDQTDDLSGPDRILSGLMMRYIECFPMCIRVYIMDDTNGDWPRAAESTGMPISVHRDLQFLDKVIESSDRISPLIVDPVKDLHDLIKNTGSIESFQLIIIRSGFTRLSQNDVRRLRGLAGGSGIITGVRMIILDDAMANSRESPEIIKERQLLFSDFTGFDMKGSRVIYQGKDAKLSSIDKDLRATIQRRCSAILKATQEYHTRAIPYEEVGFGKEFKVCKGPSISIPVGKSGTDIVSIELFCKDDGANKELNTSYMVIGMTSTGKSSLLHSIIINGSMMYSPKDLNFWLLDGKSKSAINKYIGSGIPHIKVISEKNDTEDANAIIGMALKEMGRRNILFQSRGVDNIQNYNSMVSDEEKLPRILILIDEVQFIINDGQQNIQQDNEGSRMLLLQIGRIARQSRFSGIHMILFAQDLEDPKTSNLKTEFISQRCGRLAFKINKPQLRSAYQNIDDYDTESLQVGTACQWTSDGRVRLVKFTHSNDLPKYIKKIATKYNGYPDNCVMVGNDEPLHYDDVSPTGAPIKDFFNQEYLCARGVKGALIGIDPYSNNLYKVDSEGRSAISVAIISTARYKEMGSSVFASLILSSVKSGDEVHICSLPGNAIIKNEINRLKKEGTRIFEHSSLKELLEDVYPKFQRRIADPEEMPISIFINNLEEMMIDTSKIPKMNVETNNEEADQRNDNPFSFTLNTINTRVNTRTQDQDYPRYLETLMDRGRQPMFNISISFTTSDTSMKSLEKYIIKTEYQCYCGKVQVPQDTIMTTSRSIRSSIAQMEAKQLYNHAVLSKSGQCRKFRPILYNDFRGEGANDIQ